MSAFGGKADMVEAFGGKADTSGGGAAMSAFDPKRTLAGCSGTDPETAASSAPDSLQCSVFSRVRRRGA